MLKPNSKSLSNKSCMCNGGNLPTYFEIQTTNLLEFYLVFVFQIKREASVNCDKNLHFKLSCPSNFAAKSEKIVFRCVENPVFLDFLFDPVERDPSFFMF